MQPIMGIQLYTLRDFTQTAESLDATLGKLAAMGVKDVQFSAIGDISADTQKAILQKHGMRVCVTHKGFDRMQTDLATMISEHETIGCDAMGLGACPEEYRKNAETTRRFIAATNKIAQKLQAAGMTFNYHNHDFEFQPLPDVSCNMMDILLSETDPAAFHFIPDVAWIHYAGYDPVSVLERMRGRVKVLHFKDYIINEAGERKFVSLGQGRVDLRACYEAAKTLQIPYIMYEQDCDWVDNDPFAATRESWLYMQKLEA